MLYYAGLLTQALPQLRQRGAEQEDSGVMGEYRQLLGLILIKSERVVAIVICVVIVIFLFDSRFRILAFGRIANIRSFRLVVVGRIIGVFGL